MAKSKRRRKLTKKESKAVGRKIKKIKEDEPGKEHKAVVGKAVGMVINKKKRKKGRKCRRKS